MGHSNFVHSQRSTLVPVSTVIDAVLAEYPVSGVMHDGNTRYIAKTPDTTYTGTTIVWYCFAQMLPLTAYGKLVSLVYAEQKSCLESRWYISARKPIIGSEYLSKGILIPTRIR